MSNGSSVNTAIGLYSLTFVAALIVIAVVSVNRSNSIPTAAPQPTLPPTPAPTAPPTPAPTPAPTLPPTPAPTAPPTPAPTPAPTLPPTPAPPTPAPPTFPPTPAPTGPCVGGVNCTTAVQLPALDPIEQGSTGYTGPTGTVTMLFNTDDNLIYRWSGTGVLAHLHTVNPNTNVYSDNLYTDPENEHPVAINGGATYDYDNQTMYFIGSSGNNVVGLGSLYTFSLLPAPTYTLVGPLAYISYPKQLVYTDGFLYTFNWGNGIQKINPSTAEQVGVTILLSGSDTIVPELSRHGLALHRPSNIVYIVYRLSGATFFDNPFALGTVDLDTAIVTPTCANHMLRINAISMGIDDRMWLSTGGSTQKLYRVDDIPCNI